MHLLLTALEMPSNWSSRNNSDSGRKKMQEESST